MPKSKDLESWARAGLFPSMSGILFNWRRISSLSAAQGQWCCHIRAAGRLRDQDMQCSAQCLPQAELR